MTSSLPILGEPVGDRSDQTAAILRSEFSEICTAWRMLTEVRFKLLALLPPVTGLGLVGIVSSAGVFQGMERGPRIGLAIFGLLITVGLYVYDRRNDELYDDLISRGRRAELEMGIDTGVFLGRRVPARSWRNHHNATRLVYGTIGLSWIAAGAFAATGRV